MAGFLLRRGLRALVVLLVLSLLISGLTHIVPGDPATIIAGEQGSPELRAQIRAQLGLDRPFLSQYLSWLGNALRGNLGSSLLDGRHVATMIADRLPVSLELALMATVLALLWGVTAGILAATYHGRFLDALLNGGSFAGVAVPPFVVGTLLVLVVSMVAPAWPVLSYVAFGADPVGNLQVMLLPALVLSIPFGAALCRYLRSSILEIQDQDFMRTAAAKGASRRRMILRHATRNALVPLLTATGLQFGVLVGGTVIIEQVFGLPGLGSLVVNSIGQHDFPVVQGAILTLGATYVLLNLVVDLLYPVVDPQIRAVGAGHGR
jgi:peptide/nickel transport system permease protein